MDTGLHTGAIDNEDAFAFNLAHDPWLASRKRIKHEGRRLMATLIIRQLNLCGWLWWRKPSAGPHG
jgi:hypothetical protein